MAELVYILCAVTSLVCAILLARGYQQSRQRLLVWSTLCFVGLFLNNLLTVVDLVIVPDVDLRWLRSAVSFASVGVLAFGLMWEAP
ncbi:MAG TPA: DUF5985 family protein [Kofleriaceae bacterium]|nr:DUF5985 family protein [Kofleriaceae bacterium]